LLHIVIRQTRIICIPSAFQQQCGFCKWRAATTHAGFSQCNKE